jgi:hypothetical protein
MVTGDGIGVTLIAPGRVDTSFWHGQGRSGPPPGPVLQPTDDDRRRHPLGAEPARRR